MNLRTRARFRSESSLSDPFGIGIGSAAMAELVSQQSSSPVYRAACELAAYRLREALADQQTIEYDGSLEAELRRCMPDEPAPRGICIGVASAVDGSCALLQRSVGGAALHTATKTSLPWLKRCGLEPGWSRPYTDPHTQHVVISFVAPLVRDGKVVAAVAAGSIAVGARGTTGKKRPAAPAWLSVTEPRLRSRLLYPNPVCLLTTWGEVDGSWRKNVMTISWLTCLNNDADVLLSINARRHSAAAVLSGRAFGLSVPTSDLAAMVLKIGACSGSKTDKLATVEGLAAVEADAEAKAGKGGFAALMSDSSDDDDGVAAPPDAPWFVEGCVARLACVVERRLTEGEDHHVVVAKITDASVREDYWDGKTFRAPHGRAPFLSFLGSQSFGHTVQST